MPHSAPVNSAMRFPAASISSSKLTKWREAAVDGGAHLRQHQAAAMHRAHAAAIDERPHAEARDTGWLDCGRACHLRA